MEITINNKEYKLPTHLNIDTYVKLFNVKDLFEDDYFEIKLINIITGEKNENILKLTHKKIKEASNHILNILPSTNFIFVDHFKIGDVEYGFIPEYKNMSFGEFADLDTLLTKKPEEIMKNLHIIAAIMFRPIISKKSKHNYKIEEYDSKTVDERSELFKKELDVSYVLGGKFFFSKFVKESYQATPLSLIQRIKKKIKSMKVMYRVWKEYRSKKRSGGSQSSIELLEMILRNMK
jgi:hypothetical protein